MKLICSYKFLINTVRIPTTINVMVAIIDLRENLPIPLIPWPLVQPPLTLVPIPTSNPANINKIKEFEIVMFISLLVNKL
jgi:hypothetical protein